MVVAQLEAILGVHVCGHHSTASFYSSMGGTQDATLRVCACHSCEAFPQFYVKAPRAASCYNLVSKNVQS